MAKPASKSKARDRLTGHTRAGGQTVEQRVEAMNRWREAYNPLRGLTIARAVALLEAAQRGEMADYQWTCYFVEQTDPDLFALLEMRLGRIVEMDYDFIAEEGADEREAERQKQLLTDAFARIDNLTEAIEHLAMASFRGYAHAEKWYDAQGNLTHFEIVDQWNVVRDGLKGPWRYNSEARSTGYRSLPAAADMPPEQFLTREVRRSINRIALLKFIRANLSDKDWDAFIEIYGIPGGVVIGPPNVPTGKEAEYETAAERTAKGGSGYLPHGSAYTPNTGARGTQPFKERLDHLSEKLVLVGTGGKLTMLAEAGSGTLAGNAHREVFDQIAAAEAARISECFNAQIVPELLGEGVKPLVFFRLAAHAEPDTGAAVDEVQKLATAGFLCDPDQVTQRTGWKVTLKPAAPALPPPFGSAAQTANRARIANREQIAAVESGFLAAARRDLSAAQAKALRPLVDRLEAILALPDDKIDAALEALQRDLPRINREVLKDAQVQLAFEQILGTALVQGAATAAEHRPRA